MSETFMSVTDLAAARGVTKQAISKNLERHQGRVPTRKAGVRKLVDVQAYDRVMGEETDPAQALRNRDMPRQSPESTPAAPMPGAEERPKATAQQVFSLHRAKREAYDADLSRLALEKELGKLVPVIAVTDAMVECAMQIIRIIDQLPSKSEDPAVRIILKAAAQEVRMALHESMKMTRDRAIEAHNAGDDAGDE
jgi:hypothetical protein